MGTKISALDASASIGADDLFVAVISGVNKKITRTVMKDQLGIDAKAGRWETIATTKYTATPNSTSRLLMSDTSDFAVGMPVKYVDGRTATAQIAIVTAISTNTHIDIAGSPFNVVNDLTSLQAGLPEMAVQMDFFISGTYADGTGTLLAADMNTYARWGLRKAYLVAFHVTHNTVDTGAEPYINVRVNNLAVSTENANAGPQLGAAGTWISNSAVAIDNAKYDIENGEAIEIDCVTAGGTGDAADLTVSCIFVLE